MYKYFYILDRIYIIYDREKEEEEEEDTEGGKICPPCTFILLKPLTQAIFYNETIKTFRHRQNCDVSQQVHNQNGAPTML